MTEEKKSGIGSWFKDLVSSEVPDRPAGPPRNTPLPPPPPGQAVFAPSNAPDPKALAFLQQQLVAAIPPAFAAFTEMYQSLAEDIPDEAKRVKVAMKTTKLTADQLGAAIDQMIGAMENVHQSFLHDQEGKLAAHQALNDSIQAKEEQLHHLQEEITSLRERSASEQAKLESVRRGFEAAHSQVIGGLQQQKARLAGTR